MYRNLSSDRATARSRLAAPTGLSSLSFLQSPGVSRG